MSIQSIQQVMNQAASWIEAIKTASIVLKGPIDNPPLLWFVFQRDDEAGKPVGRVYRCTSESRARNLAHNMSHDRGFPVIDETS